MNTERPLLLTLSPSPQDDLPAEQFGDDCACDFTPYEDKAEESWHFLRRCSSCGRTWYCLHCRCEQPDVASRCDCKQRENL
jgi:hypothetical protein